MPRKKTTSSQAAKKMEETMATSAKVKEENDYLSNDFNPSPRFYRAIALTFLGVTLFLVILVIFFLGGKAVISLTLKPQTVKADTNLTVAAAAQGKQAAGLVLAATVKGEKSFSPSGGSEIPASAIGQVIIYNKTSAAQPLVATTRLLSPEKVLFRLKNSALAPANGQVTAEVYADKPGRAGEIGPAKFIIPGLSDIKQKDIYAESKVKFSNGVKRLAAITDADLKAAEESLVAGLYNQGQTQLINQAKASSTNFSANLFTYTKNFVKTEAKVGAVADNFKLAGEIQVAGVFYNPEDLRNLLLAGVEENLANNQELAGPAAAPSIQINKYDLAAKTANLRVIQEFLVRTGFTDEALDKTKLLGQPKADALAYLKNLSWIDKAEIKTQPSWLKKIPSEASKVEIKVSE